MPVAVFSACEPPVLAKMRGRDGRRRSAMKLYR